MCVFCSRHGIQAHWFKTKCRLDGLTVASHFSSAASLPAHTFFVWQEILEEQHDILPKLFVQVEVYHL